MKEIKVFGHKNPDTDSVLSAIIFSNLLEMGGFNSKAYKLGKLNNETKYLLDLFKVEYPKTIENIPNGTLIALVDHNEASQSIDNLKELEIEYIIDHHKVDINTLYPINMRFEKLCSTASILYKMYKEKGIPISTQIAQLIIASILSDSLFFKSPITTEFDKEICEELKDIAGIENLEKLAYNMFDAKSDLGNISAKDLVKYDYKEFEINGIKFGGGAIETTSPNYSLNRKEEILNAMDEIKKEDGLDFIILSIIDILNEQNTSIVLDGNDTKIVEQVFSTKINNNLADLGKRLSRKKQIVPQLTDYFA